MSVSYRVYNIVSSVCRFSVFSTQRLAGMPPLPLGTSSSEDPPFIDMTSRLEFVPHCTVAETSDVGGVRHEAAYEQERSVVHRLLSLTDIPEWQRPELTYIQTGYREITPCCMQCVKSWRYMHNETGTVSNRFAREAMTWC